MPRLLRRGALLHGQVEYLLLGGLIPVQYSGNAAVAHDHDAVGHAQDLGHFRGDQYDGVALLGQVAHDAVDFGFRADIHTLGGFVHDDHFHLLSQCLGDDHLLLVAAGEGACGLENVHGLGIHVLQQLFGDFPFLLFVVQAALCKLAHDGQRHVAAQAPAHQQAFLLTVFRQQYDAEVHGVLGLFDVNLPALQVHLAGVGLGDAADAFDDLGPARAHQSGKAQDLARMNREGGILEEAGAAEPLDLQHLLADLYLGFGEQVADLAANHGFDQVGVGNFIDVVGTDVLGIAEYGHTAGQPVHVFKAVGDENDGDALLPQLIHDAVQFLGFPLGQRRGGLVQYDDLCIGGKRFGNLNNLLLGDGQGTHFGGCAEVSVHALEQLVCLFVHGPPLDDAVFNNFVTHEDVFGHGQIRI